jgi:hypothetical protein
MMEAFSRKDGMDNKGIGNVPKLTGDNYLIGNQK